MKHWMGLIVLAGVLSGQSLMGQDLAGKWQLTSKDAKGNPETSELTIREEGGELKGVLKVNNTTVEAKRMKREGAKAVFEIERENAVISMELVALDGGKLEGKWKSGEGEGAITGVKAEGDGTGVWKVLFAVSLAMSLLSPQLTRLGRRFANWWKGRQ